jgi:hypothetical protein
MSMAQMKERAARPAELADVTSRVPRLAPIRDHPQVKPFVERLARLRDELSALEREEEDVVAAMARDRPDALGKALWDDPDSGPPPDPAARLGDVRRRRRIVEAAIRAGKAEMASFEVRACGEAHAAVLPWRRELAEQTMMCLHRLVELARAEENLRQVMMATEASVTGPEPVVIDWMPSDARQYGSGKLWHYLDDLVRRGLLSKSAAEEVLGCVVQNHEGAIP